MKLKTISLAGGQSVAVEDGAGNWIDLAAADASLPATMQELVERWEELEDAVRKVASGGAGAVDGEAVTLAPLPRPRRDIICVGKNYHEHAREFSGSGFDSSGAGQVVPTAPVIFTKATTSVTGPGQTVPGWKDTTGTVDYEGELAVVIGRGGAEIAKADAFDHVFGYMVVNDVTSRELQRRHQQWFIGKGIDGFCPAGPWLVTRDEVPDVTALRVTTHVNGELRQDALVADLIFDIPTLIETISASVTLEPGDIIATGTPAGVGIGFSPPRYLADGDVVRVEITGLGILENTISLRR